MGIIWTAISQEDFRDLRRGRTRIDMENLLSRQEVKYVRPTPPYPYECELKIEDKGTYQIYYRGDYYYNDQYN